MKHRPCLATVAVLGFAIQVATYADINQTVTLSSGGYLNLDTGATTSSTPGAGDVYDIQLTDGIVGVGKAKIYTVGIRTPAQFGLITQTDILNRGLIAGVRSIPASSLVVNYVFDAITNNGNASKIMVISNSGGQLQLNVYTYQNAAPGAPKITDVLNNSSLIASGSPNSGIAPSSLFIVRGSGMSDPGDPVLQSSLAPGLQTTLMGASISVTVNGVTTHPALWYASPGQLAAVLPASTPVGSGTLTVAYNGLDSAPFTIQVLPSAVGINSYGANYGVATDALSYALLTFTTPGTPGENIVLWATGLGADPADSDTTFTSTPHAVATPMQVFIGGVQARILYQGSSGYPGVTQINVTIPDAVPTGCWVPLAAITGAVVSNITTVSISKDGGPCVDAVTGLTGNQISPGVKTKYRAGLVSLILNSANTSPRSITYTADGSFASYTALTYDPGNSLSPGGCIVREPVTAPGVSVGLDSGSLTLTGPNGLDVTLALQFGIKGLFAATLPDGAIPQSGGTFTFKGTGGADVGSFTSALNLSNPLLTWTNPSVVTNIDKSQGVTVNWSGGNPGSYIYISGGGGKGSSATVFECLAYADDGKFTIPPYVLLAVPTGTGSVAVQNIIYAPLKADGLDVATAAAYVGYSYSANFGSGVSK